MNLYTWVLVLVVQTGSGNSTLKYEQRSFSTLSECERSAKTFNAKTPSGGDAEVSIAVFCSKGGMKYESGYEDKK